jgi:hypothetical protein
MKQLKYGKKIQMETFDKINLITNDLEKMVLTIDNYCNKLNQEFAKRIIQLIDDIAEGEHLDAAMLKEKYFKSHTEINESETIKNSEEDSDIILEVSIINGETYYYENKDHGKVFNNKSIHVGIYKNNKIIINEPIEA